MFSPDIEDPNDRVEVAFRRLDSDGDGYLDIEDFYQVRSSENKAHQIQDYSHGIKSLYFTTSRPDWETQWLAGLYIRIYSRPRK